MSTPDLNSQAARADVAPGPGDGCRCSAAGDPLMGIILLLMVSILVLRRR